MDCFFAAIELLERPELVDSPVAIGASPDQRGVVATCNYPARKFGIHSAMAMSRALLLCPHLIVLPVDMGRYRVTSERIKKIFNQYTDLVEPLSLDEAFLDVSESRQFQGSATLLAKEIRKQIFDQEGLTASAGIAPNKFLAKVASDWNKPNGQMVIPPGEVEAFVYRLPVKKIPGVGRVTAAKMRRLAIQTCGDLQRLTEEELSRLFGRFGERLFQLCRGIDHRPVKTTQVRKSLSVERTFARDLHTREQNLAAISPLFDRLTERLGGLRKSSDRPCKTLFVKVKFANFRQTTLQRTAAKPDLDLYQQLCAEAMLREARPIRLLGLGVHFGERTTEPPKREEPVRAQLALFND